MTLTGEKPKYSGRTFPSVLSSTTNFIWTELRSKPDLRGERFATRCLRQVATLAHHYSAQLLLYILNLLKAALELIIISVTEFQTIDKLMSDY
jgi:hypothetical protein